MEEGLIGALIGGLLTGGAQLLAEWLKNRNVRRNLVVALAAEAAAVAEIVRRREWLPQIIEFANDAEKGDVHRFQVHLPDELITCSRAAASNAGLLPGRLPGLVARFVMLTDGAASDIRRLASFPIDDENGFLNSKAPKSAHRIYVELLAVLVHALWTCDMIVLEAKEHYAKETKDLLVPQPSLIEQVTRNEMTRKAQPHKT